jgi:hypothetical protein
MILTRMWKKGTASIIIDPFPPGKILPPREKISWDTMHLLDQMRIEYGEGVLTRQRTLTLPRNQSLERQDLRESCTGKPSPPGGRATYRIIP